MYMCLHVYMVQLFDPFCVCICIHSMREYPSLRRRRVYMRFARLLLARRVHLETERDNGTASKARTYERGRESREFTELG